MVLTRKAFKLEDYITLHHLDAMAKVTLATGTMVGFAYATEFFTAWYSGSLFERYVFLNRSFGPYAWAYWIMVSCNVLSPQVFWFRWARRTPWFIFIFSIFVNIGMWFERFVIIVSSLHRDFLPSSWQMYTPTIVEWGILAGTFGIFFTLYMLFAKGLPVVAIAEVKSIMRGAGEAEGVQYLSGEKDREEAYSSAGVQPAFRSPDAGQDQS
jgi:molybdopterin-containing oxidoreductase family membrane subunit